MHTLFGCRLARGIIRERAGESGELPARVQRHVENCADCRRFYEEETETGRQLAAGASSQRRAASPFLHAKIMRSINEARDGGLAGRGSGRRSWGLGGLAAGVLLLAAIWVPRGNSPGYLANPRTSRPEQAISGWPLEVRIPDQNQVRGWIGKVDGPLENEMNLVVDDAKTAFNSLAANFLPADDRSR